MPSLTITLSKLRSLVDPVLPLAGRDDMFPVLMGVQIRSHGRWLVATSTDRYRVGMKRIAAYDADGHRCEWPEFEALISTAALRSILTTFKGGRYSDPELSLHVNGDRLEVEASGGLMFDRASIAYPLVAGGFPNVGALFQRAQECEGPAVETGFDPRLMADFKAVGARALSMKRGAGAGDPIFVTDCEDFVGLLMPRKVTTDTPAEAWDEIFAGKPEAPKKAAPKKKPTRRRVPA